MEQLADVMALALAEHKRLTGGAQGTVFSDDGPEQDVQSQVREARGGSTA